MTEQFIDEQAPERWGVYCGRDDGGPLAVVATWIERTVFRELYGVPEDAVGAEFSPFGDRTVWSVIVHHPSKTAVGAARSLVGPARELLATRDLREIWGMSWDESCAIAGADPDGSFIEAASMSVLPEWRSADRMWPVKTMCSSYMHLFEDLQADWAIQIINPTVKRLFEGWGTPFVLLSGPRQINNATFVPAFIPRIPGRPFFKTKDKEYFELMQHRSETGRSGTRLPKIDLDNQALVVQVDAEIREKSAERAEP